MPLVGSIALGIGAALIAGVVLAVVTYSTKVIWYYAYVLFGAAIGIGFHYRAEARTWRLRSTLSAAVTLVSLFFAEYFLTRALAIDALHSRGTLLPGETVPLFVAPGTMVQVVADAFRAHPTYWVVWAVAVFLAYTIPSANHRAASKRGQAMP